MATKKSISTRKKTNHSNAYYQKKAVKEVSKYAKKNPKVFLIILLVVAIVAGIGLAVYFLFIRKPQTPVVVEDGISIHFLMPGNKGNGDSIYIKAGETDILIDAGCTQSSAGTIKEYVDQYCTDNKLEYVIATHADSDHIAGFVGTNSTPGIFDSYKIGTLIQFARSDKTTTLYSNYCAKRDAKVTSGDIEHYYTAKDCIDGTNGAQKEYVFNESIKMTILDQRYYHEDASDENDYSVCTLFTHGNNHYLFTGDLEKKGEASLVDKNNLPHCQLFKAGHHGSKTSSNDSLLSVIRPEVVCICCTAGYNEYHSLEENVFPTQTAINNIGKYTDKVYVTQQTSTNAEGYEAMNGNIVFKCTNGVDYTVTGSNNSTILKETEWFQANRTWPTSGV